MKEYYRMPDLTLYEFSELNEEEIKNRLLEDYNTIRYHTVTQNEKVNTRISSLKGIKSF